jgi:hypothetical protein
MHIDCGFLKFRLLIIRKEGTKDIQWNLIQRSINFFLIRVVGGGVHTGATLHVGHFWPIVPAPGDCEDGE